MRSCPQLLHHIQYRMHRSCPGKSIVRPRVYSRLLRNIHCRRRCLQNDCQFSQRQRHCLKLKASYKKRAFTRTLFFYALVSNPAAIGSIYLAHPPPFFYHRPRIGSIGLARPAVGFLSPVHPSPVRRHRCRPPKQPAAIRRSVPTLSLVKLRPLAHILRQKFRQLIQPRRSRSLFMTAAAERRRNRRYVHIVFHRAERQIPFAAFV